MRKKKTNEIVKAKRRKIIEAISKGKYTQLGIDPANLLLKIQSDTDLSIEQMNQQFYQGYPQWRKDNYKSHMEILLKIINAQDF